MSQKRASTCVHTEDKTQKVNNGCGHTDDKKKLRVENVCCGHTDDKKKQRVENIIKPALFSTEIREKLSKAIREGKDYESDCGLHVYSEPFQCYVIKDFLSDTNYVHKLKNELSDMEFYEKSNDLFKFQQSKDLIENTSKHTVILRDLLFNTFREWLQDIMEVTFDSTCDLFCAKYEYTDVLLCHDDELEGRCIAFIYYLVPEDWNEKDGGTLDLFSVDENGHPDKVVRSIIPTFNSLAFFEVSDKSFHQISEILSKCKTRMSLSGWFYGESPTRQKPLPLPEVLPQPAVLMEDDLLLSWINPMYLNPDIVTDIEEQFEENSEIQLKDFLLEEKYNDLVKELNSSDVSWIKQGPANKRLCWSSHCQPSCKSIPQFLQLIKSTPFFKLLMTFTGLQLAILDGQSDEEEEGVEEEFDIPPSCVVEVRQWKHGCYTLLQDCDPCGEEFALDALFHLQCDDWNESMDGGYISYIASDGGNEVMRVDPTSNCLSLVYRDEQTSRFVKYLNHKLSEVSCKQYYDISAVYFEGKKR